MLTHFRQHNVVEQNNGTVTTNTKKTKLLFYHASTMFSGIWLYPTALQLKTYIDLLYPNLSDQIEWLIPLQLQTSSQELIEYIKQHKVDILCTSHYLWNHEFLTDQLSEIKNSVSDKIKFIAGGPNIDVNNNYNFFEQYPYIDYAVYGPGEQAFADILNHLVLNKPLMALATSNCAWKNHKTGKSIVADYKFVKMIETSPFLHNKKLFSDMVQVAKKIDAPIWTLYGLTRGCPYSCTFCDWNSGLGNKVSRRKNTYQQEIDLFQQLGLKNIFLTDANVGQYTEDVEMIDYFAQKNLKENAGFHVGGNFSKLKKENNLKIFNSLAQGQLVYKTLNFSVQEINRQVLENIDRPDVGWDVHVAMADELRQKYPHLIIKAQLIYGLPGQTPAIWKHTLDQVTQNNMLPVIFLNEPLPASPAVYNPKYQQQFEFEYVYSNRINANGAYLSQIPKQSKFFNQQDIVQMNVLSAVYTALSVINFTLQENNIPVLNISAVVDEFLQSIHFKNLHNNLYDNWGNHNNFYYTVNFSGQEYKMVDYGIGPVLVHDLSFLQYVATFFSPNDRLKFLVMIADQKFQKMAKELAYDID